MTSRVKGVAVAVVLACVVTGLAPGAWAAPRGPIASGQTVNATFTANTEDSWSFTYASGQVVALKAAPTTGSDKISVSVRDAGNVERKFIGCTGNPTVTDQFTLAAPGAYTANVKSCNTAYAAGYNLSFLNLTAGPLRAAGDPAVEGAALVSGQTVRPTMGLGDMDAFQFRAEAGERVVFSAAQVSTGPNPRMWLYAPVGTPTHATTIFSGNADRQEATLAYAGTYTLVVLGQDLLSAGDYLLTFQKLPGAASDCYSALPDADGGVIAAAPGATVGGSIARKTDLDAWQFHAAAGQTATVALSRELRLALYAPQAQRQYGTPVYAYPCGTALTTHTIPLTASGFYELLVEDCATTTAGGAYTLILDLPAETAPPPLAAPVPAACGALTNPFAAAAMSWDPLPAAAGYELYLQQQPLGPVVHQASVPPPPSGRPLFPLPYRDLRTGNLYTWHLSASDTLATTWGPTHSFGFYCTPGLTVSPDTVAFGDVVAGTAAAPVTVTITNTGTCTQDPRVASAPTGFTILSDTCTGAPAGGHLAPGASCSLQVGFAPAAPGVFAGGLVLDGVLPEAHDGIVDLSGRGYLPDLRLAAVSAPAGPLLGDLIDVTDTVDNLGDGPAAASAVTYRFSLDRTITAADPAAASGSRATPQLAAGASSSGTASVGVPGTLPVGSWYVGACVDAAGLVVEGDEANNCLATAATLEVSRDVAVAAVTDTPVLAPDGTFSFTDTTRNVGSLPVGASVTGYRLSLDQKITRLDPVLAVTRPVPALTAFPDAAHFSTATVTLAVPSDTPRGAYFVAACADANGQLAENSETNNCRLSRNPIRVEADLRVSAVSAPPGSPFVGYAGASFSVTDTTVNAGVNAAAATTTRYRLSLDATITGSDTLLTGTRAVPALGVGGTSTGTVTVTVPAATPAGDFYLAACADDAKAVPEADEDNNCRVSATRVTIARVDLTVTAVGDPPAARPTGGSFSVSDTTRNGGTVPALASVTNYRLSTDATVNAGDTLLEGTRAVPALAAGASSSGGVTVTIPATVAPGSYYLGACADGGSAVAETSETNNCRASAAQITVTAPDLRVTALSDPPASVSAGASFSVTDTTANASASVAAAASVTRYRLSADTTVTGTDTLLTGTRAVPALAAGQSSAGTVSVTIPLSLAAGTYYLAACADDGLLIAESSETNNCRLSAGTLSMQHADLLVSAVSSPPAAGLVGDTFAVSDTVANAGAVAAAASTTRYRLSADATVNGSDPLLTGARAVPALGAGQSSAGAGTVVTIPAAVPTGTFYLAACADDGAAVPETSETNNCRLSTGTISIAKPDLTVTAVSEPPLDIDPGLGFEVTDTTVNAGTTAAAASATRYRLSLDQTVTTADTLLIGSRAVPSLAPGGASTGTVTVTLPLNLVQGSYFLAACADTAEAIAESSEENNCALSTGTLDVLNADLQVVAVSDPPAEGFVGTVFAVTDTTRNAGAAATTAATVTRFRLSADLTITAADTLLTETPANAQHRIAALAPGETSQATVNVTIPATIAPGTYYLAGCADTANAVTESSETNNCRVAAAQIQVKKPDLGVSALSNPPAEAFAGSSFDVTDTTTNAGLGPVTASTTRFRLSADATVTSTDPLLAGTRSTGALAAGASSTGTVSVTIPAALAQGTYYLAACADDAGTVSESDETNNCRVAAATVDLKLANLRVTAVSSPPGTATPGSSFDVTDTTANAGIAAASASTTRYRLSSDTAINAADPLLTGTRAPGALAAGASSTGTVTVTVPGTITQGTYYLAACADDAGTVSESDEGDNCRVAAGTLSLQKADLQVTALSNPPAGGTVGMSFTVTDTTANQGAAAGGASVTQYRLSEDATITAADPLLTGTRAVGALAVGAAAAGGATVTIPDSVAQGTYYLGACADGTQLVAESDEGNNCRASATTISLAKADMRVTAVSSPPAEGTVGATITITDTTANAGSTAAAASTTRFRLSADATITAADTAFTATRAVPALAPGESSTGSVTLTIPAVAQGTYYVGACADDANTVPESVETNNCTPSAGQVWVKKPDLVATAVSNPPAEGFIGSSFAVTDTTENRGLAAAGASTTRYRLSPDATVTSADPLLTGSRAAGALAVGASSTGTVTVTIPATVSQGTYYLAACADDTSAVSESTETNNCTLAATTIALKKPDLRVTALSDPPAEGFVGTSFTVTDTTENSPAALAEAGASTTRFRLSADTEITSSDALLTGARAVELLAVGAASAGSTTLTIPGAVAQGTYYLGACADDAAAVSESDEGNNCLVAGQIQVKKPDLRATAVSDPPAQGLVGSSFAVTDTTENLSAALAAAGASTTRYRLSTDQAVNGADPLLTGTRAVGVLAVGGVSSGTVTVTVPGNVPQGLYYLGACADDAAAVSESDETNNCVASLTRIELRKADLAVEAVSDPPAEGVAGDSFTVTDTTRNLAGALAGAAATVTRYRLSPDATVTIGDLALTGSRAVAALAVGEASSGTVSVSIPATIAQGQYYLGACADDDGTVSESDEGNNCRASGGRILVKRPDLTVTAVSEPPALGVPGGTFTVDDTVTNAGLTATTAASTTRFRLSLDRTITTADTLLTGTRTVAPLAVGAASSGTATVVTVPASIAGGIYYLGACADATSTVAESDEGNNCRASTGTINLHKPDLAVTAFSLHPLPANPLLPLVATAGHGSFDVAVTTQNLSAQRAAEASTTRFYLSLDAAVTAADPRLAQTQAVPQLAPGAGATAAPLALAVPATVADGTYALFACADDTLAVVESSEANCVAAATPVTVVRPNLYCALSTPNDTTLDPGQSTVVWGSVTNGGVGAAAPSTTRFRLSADTAITGADLLLEGTLAVPELAAGTFHDAPATVTVPAGTPPGSYYLAGCADDLQAAAETDEADNCGIWAGTFVVRGADLRVTAVSEPPALVAIGEGFTVDDTVANEGLFAAAGTEVSYYLSLDATYQAGDRQLAGSRAVPALAAGADSAGSGTAVTVPTTVSVGQLYYLIACADGAGAVPETDEADNCRASAGRVEISFSRPDLVVSALLNPPTVVTVGGSFDVSDTTRNTSPYAYASLTSATRYYLSPDLALSADDAYLGSRTVPVLAPLAPSIGTAFPVSVPAGAPADVPLYLVACADAGGVITESDETNNCRFSATRVTVRKADLVVAFDQGEAETSPGDYFGLLVTVTNASTIVAAAPSTVRFLLSADAAADAGDVLLTGSMAVSWLSPQADTSQVVVVDVPVTTPPGTYHFLACADYGNAVPEADETNNCTAWYPTVVVLADLEIASVSGFPATVYAGAGFSLSETTASTTGGSTVTFRNAYYLSADATIGAGDVLLSGSRTILQTMIPHTTDTATVAVTIPAGTPPGTYYVGACADAANAVPELSETNNCRASATTLQVQAPTPDLRATAVSDPPANINPYATFAVTDTTQNVAPIAGAGASTTSYYLSRDAVPGGDHLLAAERAVPALAAGASSTATVTVTVPVSVPGGYFYRVLACADRLGVVAEADETNNCVASTGAVWVNARPDLSSLIDLSYTPPVLFPGQSFTQWNTVDNAGNAPADAIVRFILSTDATITAADRFLTGAQVAAGLAPGAFQWSGTDVTVPASPAVPEGEYYLAACADFDNTIAETDETNNCSLSGGQFLVRWAALSVTDIPSFPAVVTRGTGFTVTDVTANAALTGGDSLAFQNSYWLSADASIDASDTAIGGRNVAAIAAGASNGGGGTAVVPGGTAPGFYYLGVCADAGNVVPEANETNNCRVTATTVEVR